MLKNMEREFNILNKTRFFLNGKKIKEGLSKEEEDILSNINIVINDLKIKLYYEKNIKHLFKNVGEFMDWEKRNCDQCKNGFTPNRDDNFRCPFQNILNDIYIASVETKNINKEKIIQIQKEGYKLNSKGECTKKEKGDPYEIVKRRIR